MIRCRPSASPRWRQREELFRGELLFHIALGLMRIDCCKLPPVSQSMRDAVKHLRPPLDLRDISQSSIEATIKAFLVLGYFQIAALRLHSLLLTCLQKILIEPGVFQSITCLELKDCKGITDLHFLAKCTRLRRLSISACRGFADVKTLPDMCPLIVALEISRNSSLRDVGEIANLSHLRELALRSLPLESVDFLALCSCLESLDLSHCTLVDDIVDLGSCKRVNILKLSNCSNIADLSPLETCMQLQSLDLSHCHQVTSTAMLVSCAHLEELNLSGCHGLIDVSSLPQLTRLKFLNLSCCTSLFCSSGLAECTSLETLDVSCCPLSALQLNVLARVRRWG